MGVLVLRQQEERRDVRGRADEAWWWGGGHNDGGTMREEVPEEWLDLPYDELLENLVALVRAGHYGFTAEHLRRKEGLRGFLGFRRRLLSARPGPWAVIRSERRGRFRLAERNPESPCAQDRFSSLPACPTLLTFPPTTL